MAGRRLEEATCKARRERAWGQQDARPCAWGAEMRSRCEVDWDEPKEDYVRAGRVLRAHTKRCAACERAEQVERALQRPVSLHRTPA